MTDAIQAEFVALTGRLDAAGRLRLRHALVRQVVSYARLLLTEGHFPAELTCLEVVERWLEQPDDPATLQAIAAQLKHEQQLEDRGQDPISEAWDAARASRVELPEAARLAVQAAREVAYSNSAATRVDAVRGRQVAAARAEAMAGRWQLAAVQAILAGKEPPLLPALPEPLDDPAEILAAIRSELDSHSVYKRGNLSELRLLMSQEQERELAQHELAQAMQCAAPLLPPGEEDRGERACLRPGDIVWADVRRLPVDGLFRRIAAARASVQVQPKLLPDAVATLLRARARRRQTTLARAAAVGLPLPVEPDLRVPLTGRYAAYWTSDLEQLCAGLDAAGLLRLKQALVEQALWYAIQLLPGSAADRGHLATLEAVEQWLSQPHTDPPANTIGPPPAGTTSSDIVVWKAMRGVADAALAPNAQSLLRALDTVVAHVTAAKTQTASTSAVATTAVARSRDYQLAAAYQIGAAKPPPIWLGPESLYSSDSLDAMLQRMSEAQHGLLRWGLVTDACSVVRRGLEAHVRSSSWMPGGWQLVMALQAWAASPEAKFHGAVLIPTATVEEARRAASAESGQMSGQLALALQTAAQPPALPERFPFVTRAVAEYSEQAVGLAGHAIAERWQLDAAYALLLGADPPPLSVLTSL